MVIKDWLEILRDISIADLLMPSEIRKILHGALLEGRGHRLCMPLHSLLHTSPGLSSAH